MIIGFIIGAGVAIAVAVALVLYGALVEEEERHGDWRGYP